MALAGAPSTRAHIPDSLTRHLRKAFVEEYDIISKNLLYPRLYNVVNSDIETEKDTVNAGLGLFGAKAEGADPDYDSPQQAYTKEYTHSSYALGVQVTLEAMQDDLHGIFRGLTKAGGGLAQVADYTKERSSMDLFNSTLTSGTVYTAGGTNYSLLSTSHFRADGSTWSNRPTNDLDLSIEALEFAIGHWMVNMVNQRGQILRMPPVLLMVGAADWALAKRLVNSLQRPQGADNDKNVIRDLDLEVLVHPLLTNDGRWLLFGPKRSLGLTYFERYKPNVIQLPVGDNGNYRAMGFYRESHGASTVSGVWGSP